MTDLLKNVENIGLIRKAAWSFYHTTGIDFEELQGESILAYYEALGNYNEEKGAVSTHVYTCIKNHLINYCKKQGREKLYIDASKDFLGGLAYGIDEVATGSIDSSLAEAFAAPFKYKFEMPEELSEKAKEIINLILYGGVELDLCLPPKMIRGQLVQELRKLGWVWEKIWASFNEIKFVLNKN